MCRVVVVCHAGAALKGYRLATLMGCGAYGNGARLTGMIDASLKITCYGRGVPDYFAIFAASLKFFVMDTYDYLTNEWHNPAKDQVVVHAIFKLLSEEYEPVMKGVRMDVLSSKIRDGLSKYGVRFPIVRDMGSLSLKCKEMAESLIHKGLFTEAQLRAQTQELWERLYQQEFPSMP